MCPLLREQVRLLAWIAVEQVAGEDWLEVEVVGVVVILWAVAAAGLQTLVLGMQSASESYRLWCGCCWCQCGGECKTCLCWWLLLLWRWWLRLLLLRNEGMGGCRIKNGGRSRNLWGLRRHKSCGLWLWWLELLLELWWWSLWWD